VRIIFTEENIDEAVKQINFENEKNAWENFDIKGRPIPQVIQIDNYNSEYHYHQFGFGYVEEAGEEIKQNFGDKFERILKEIKKLPFLDKISEALQSYIGNAAYLNNWQDDWEKIKDKSKEFITSLFIPLVTYYRLNPGIKQIRYFVPGTWWDERKGDEGKSIRIHTASCGLLLIYDEEAIKNFEELEFETQSYSLKNLASLCNNEKYEKIMAQPHCLAEIFTHIFSQNYTIEKWIEKTKADFLKASLGSAVAAIMARNMSHNIGSHVLSYLGNGGKKDSFKFDDANFFSYLQGRMDFIAECVSNPPFWGCVMELKNDILDKFVNLGKKPTLLNHIGKSAIAIKDKDTKIKFLGGDKIEITIKIHDERDNEYEINYHFLGNEFKPIILKQPEGDEIQEDEGYKFEDLKVEIPHGMTGVHAFYSILENFLRNSIKHGADQVNKILLDDDGKLRITIEFEFLPGNENDTWPEQDEYIRVRIKDNLANFSPCTEKKINNFIEGQDSAIVNKEDGSINPKGWGIKEMRICAAWLRMVEPRMIQSYLKPPPTLQILKANENQNTTYQFFMLKPKQVFLITKEQEIEEDPKNGIYVRNLEELKQKLGERKLRCQFLVFNDDCIDTNWLKDNFINLPARTIIIKNNENFEPAIKRNYVILNIGEIDLTDTENLYFNLYKAYLKNFYNRENAEEGWVYEGALYNLVSENNKSNHMEIEKLVKVKLVNKIPKPSNVSFCFYHDKEGIEKVKTPYSEKYSSTDTTGNMLRYIFLNQNKLFLLKLYEAVLSRVMIADERIFNKFSERKDPEIWEKNRLKGIDIINIIREENGRKRVIKGGFHDKIDLKKFFNDLPENKYTFFTIHQGLITDIIGEELFKELCNEVISHKFKYIIIHSGRGLISITKGFKFLSLSNLENFIENKIALVELLTSVKGGS
jgi:hypothetical protein